VFLVVRGASAALAGLAGGLIVAVGSAVLGWRAFKPGVAGAATLTTAMYTGVALKWLWLALALYVALARLRLDAAPLLIGMLAAQFGYWAGLIRLK
jgi:F0F1-type ATP synthase assembly protein I